VVESVDVDTGPWDGVCKVPELVEWDALCGCDDGKDGLVCYENNNCSFAKVFKGSVVCCFFGYLFSFWVYEDGEGHRV
jgi:hypothetical protein